MLVLTRNFNEKILINPGEMGQITITYIGLRNGSARLAFQAPRTTVIHREEFWEQIKAERGTR